MDSDVESDVWEEEVASEESESESDIIFTPNQKYCSILFLISNKLRKKFHT